MESAAAAAALDFDMSSVPYKRCWSDTLQWPPATPFTGGCGVHSLPTDEEPLLKSAKLDGQDVINVCSNKGHHV